MSNPAERRLSSTSTLYQGDAHSSYTEVGEPPHRMDTCNVVICGEAGAGKSSLVNLIAGADIAVTSFDAGGCTSGINVYDNILIQNETLKVKFFDTAGLGEGPEGIVPDEKARRMLKKLIRTLTEQGGIHLVMYCVRGERVIRTLRRNYELIRSQVKRKVPIVLVVTCLESYQPEMEDWWRVNERTISNLGMTFAGHACITTATMIRSRMERRAQSYEAVCKLIGQCRVPSKMVARKKYTNIVLFGQAGAGKSSLVNLMAGKDVVANTFNDLESCTLRWKEYPIEFDGESYKVFETVGLEEPQLGIPQYLDAIENAYTLIQHLERQGGIDLLLFCMRAGRLTSTLQSNYRLFYEFLCDKKVPIVLAITNLETERRMEDWWEYGHHALNRCEIQVAGHACITTITGYNDCYQSKYQDSRTAIRNLIKEFTADGQRQASWMGGYQLVLFVRKLRELLVGNGKLLARKDLVPRLIKRCGMSPDVAKQLADRIKNDVV
ncbi:P-loop containing nucleoside triphosphate hydrolase protein [Suillus bovinus]|uniref:P-loop containing nucleoside triphosphate hydrolase protein n=1 Tax=Suillus bovinus TaxID=48563 RepID=UPI001B86DA42|nr:P-loop containing nucleoside triphosphate hydrolase protein [Suillus bovinus]KAG2151284.1 P-loop containing nucleoside triphosphate hydrolase protein [Suillus bovinus]